MTLKIMEECEEIRRILEHRAEELKIQETLKDIEAKRADWERRSALFVPSKQRLERGGKTLELGEDYEAIKELRKLRDKNKIRQAALRDEMAAARTELHNAEEALTLVEAEYRDKLMEQTKLNNLVMRVKALDEQTAERKDAAIKARIDFDESEKKLKECTEHVENEQKTLEKIELELREARKFLQLHSIDERLISALSGIQKCFGMYEAAEEKRILLKDSREKAITRRQQAQSVLNDRSALFSDVSGRYSVVEKNFARSRSFYESTLRGKTIPEWRRICEKNSARLDELDELYKKFQEEKSLQERLKNVQEMKLRIQQETRTLNIRDVEQAGKIHELQSEIARLEKRTALLHRIQDLDAVRELLQDGIACPLCGSITHPYTSGIAVPDPEEIHNQLHELQHSLDELHDELTARQTRAGKLGEEISSVMQDENDLRREISALNAEISSKISMLGLRLGTGISPFDELDRERQKTRDNLQLARNAAETAEAAERDMKATGDELEKIRQTREEVSRFHQDALFSLQNEKSEEEHLDDENKTQEEIVTSLKRELISQIMPFGYKSLPDKNPSEVIETLEKRLQDWQEGSKKCDTLERELSVANTKMSSLKKERESLRVRCEELASRAKAVESERDSVQQQRIIIFASKNPDDEQSRMNQDIEILRTQLNERREAKNDKSEKLERLLSDLHTLETEMARSREDLQRYEINFNKKLLSLGFKNEDDYAAACLTTDERRDLQNKLRELTQTDIELNSERENMKARLLEVQFDGQNMSNDEINIKLSNLKNDITELNLKPVNDPEEAEIREKINAEFLPQIKDLILTCGLPEVF